MVVGENNELMWISFNNSIHCMRIEKNVMFCFGCWLKIQMHAWNFILPSRKVHIPIHESAYPQARKCILSSINRDRESSNQINCVQMFSHLIQINCFNNVHTYYSDTTFSMWKKIWKCHLKTNIMIVWTSYEYESLYFYRNFFNQN